MSAKHLHVLTSTNLPIATLCLTAISLDQMGKVVAGIVAKRFQRHLGLEVAAEEGRPPCFQRASLVLQQGKKKVKDQSGKEVEGTLT